MIRAAVVTVSAGLASAAAGQGPPFTTDSTVTMHMAWREATSSGGTIPSPDGVLEPGESALISIDSVSFTNQFAIGHFAPAAGTFSSGVIFGMGWGFVDIIGSGDTQGAFNLSTPIANSAGTSGFGVRGPWRIAGNGRVNSAADGIVDLQFGQQGGPALQISDNPVRNVYRFLWTPSEYVRRTTEFNLGAAAVAGNVFAALDFEVEPLGFAFIYVPLDHVQFGSVSIPIIPVPATGATLLIGASLLVRRRRS